MLLSSILAVFLVIYSNKSTVLIAIAVGIERYLKLPIHFHLKILVLCRCSTRILCLTLSMMYPGCGYGLLHPRYNENEPLELGQA